MAKLPLKREEFEEFWVVVDESGRVPVSYGQKILYDTRCDV